MPPPMRFSRDLLTRGISYKLQERAYGGLSTATARKLGRASADPLGRGAVKPAPPISLKSGTRLVREWRGVTAASIRLSSIAVSVAAVRAPKPWVLRVVSTKVEAKC